MAKRNYIVYVDITNLEGTQYRRKYWSNFGWCNYEAYAKHMPLTKCNKMIEDLVLNNTNESFRNLDLLYSIGIPLYPNGKENNR